MNRTVKNLLLALLLLTSNLLGGCAVMYSSDDVKGRIVDEETGEPIEGAVVVGIWQLESQGFEHSYGAAIHVVESVSDAQGHYRLKGFDTKWVGHLRGELMDRDPKVSVYAEGYRPTGAGRDISEPGKGYHRVSPLNGKDIELNREALDDRFIAGLWGSGIRMLVDDAGCAITKLTALKVLLEQLEPQYNRYLMEGYGMERIAL